MLRNIVIVLVLFSAFIALLSCSSKWEKAEGTESGMALVDSDMQAVLNAHAKLQPLPIENLSAADARRQPTVFDAYKLVMGEKGKDPNDPMGVVTQDITIKNTYGDMQARIYRKSGTESRKLPIVVYYHGGGFVLADIDTYDATPRSVASMANVIVVSCNYRLAPEHKFPAAHDDAFTAYQWVLANAVNFGGDATRVAVMGESAGANLAINTAIKARDNNMPLPMYQVLIYPIAGVNMNTESYNQYAYAKPLNKPIMAWFFKNALKSRADKKDQRLDIVGRANLNELPPTTLILAEIDPLRSEGELLGARLRAAGVAVHEVSYPGVTHEFFGMGRVVEDAKTAEGVVASDLEDTFMQ